MSEVTFEEETVVRVAQPATKTSQGIMGMVMRSGVVKTESQAAVLLLGLALAVIAFSIIFYIRSNPERPAPTPLEVKEFEDMKRNGKP